MFEEEYRRERNALDSLSSKLSQVQSRYLREAEKMMEQFESTENTTKKEIEEAILSLQKELEKTIKDLRAQVHEGRDETLKRITSFEEQALRRIEDYRSQCDSRFHDSAISMMIYEGEL